MFLRNLGKERSSREVLSEYDLGRSVVKFLETAISPQLHDNDLRVYLRRRRPELNLHNRQLALLAKIDLLDDDGLISVGSNHYDPKDPLIDSGSLSIEDRVLYGIIFNRSNPDFSVEGIKKQANRAVRIAVETMFNIKNAQNLGKQPIPRDKANEFAMEYFAKYPKS